MTRTPHGGRLALLISLGLAASACGGGGGGGGGAGFVTPLANISGQVAGDSSSFSGPTMTGTGRVAIRGLNNVQVERLSNTLGAPVVAAFVGTTKLAAADVSSTGRYALTIDTSLVPDGSELQLRFYDGGRFDPAQVNSATTALGTLRLPARGFANGLALTADVILTGGLTPTGERLLARVTRSDHAGATIVYDNGADTNNDGLVQSSDAALRLSFADGLRLFDRDFDGTFGDDVIAVNRSPQTGNPDPTPLFNSAGLFDTDLDGFADGRPSGDPQQNVDRLVVTLSDSQVAADGQATTRVTARLFANSNGSPFATLINLTVNTGSLADMALRGGLVAGADGALEVSTTFTASSMLGATATVQAEVDGTTLTAAAATVQVDPVGARALSLRSDKATILTGMSDSATLTANVSAFGLSSTVRGGTPVAFSSDIGALSSGAVGTQGGVATVTFNAGGITTNRDATITASVQRDDGSIASQTLTVRIRTRSITVNPASATLTTLAGMGSTQQLTVVDSSVGTDLTSNTLTSYMSSNTDVATVNTAGLITARGPGQTTVQVLNQGVTQTVRVTVDATPNSIAITPKSADILRVRQTSQLDVSGAFTGVGPVDIRRGSTGTTYSSDNPEVVSVSADGLLTARRPGTATVTAMNRGQSDSISVTALRQTPTDVNLTSSGTVLATGGQNSVVFTASPTDVTGAPVPDGTAVTFRASVGVLAQATVRTVGGVATTSLSAGAGRMDGDSADVTAQVQGFNQDVSSNTVSIDFRDRFITIEPAQATLTAFLGAGSTLQTTVREGISGVDITGDPSTTFQSADNSIATVDGTGLVTAINNGVTMITATNAGVSASLTVTVDVTPMTISVTPGMAVLQNVNDTLSLTVNGNFGAAGIKDLSRADRGTTYAINMPGIVTVGPNGLVTAVSPGTVTITARNRGLIAQAQIQSIPNATRAIALTVDKMLVATNGTDTATLTATLQPAGAAGMIPDGTTVNFTTTAGMLSSATATTTGGVATVTISSGAAMDMDVANISATSAGFQGAVITSNAVSLTFRDRFLQLAPSPVSLTAFSGAGSTQQLTVTDSITSDDLTNDANTTYMSSDTDVVTVSATGLITAVNNGSATVTASNTGANGMVMASVDVTPQAITIAPANSAIAMVGGTQALMVSGDFGADGMRDQTLMARGTLYQSSDDTVATVSVDGVVTAVTPGTVTITATNRGQMATATVESLPNTTAMVAITIDKMTVATNGTDVATITATLTPTGASGMIPDGTVVNFSATNGMLSASSATTTNGVATVTIASGAAVDGDMADITATTGGFQGATLTSNTLTVTFRDRFLNVAPSPVSLTAFSGAGSTQQLTVTDSISGNDVTADPNTMYASSDMSVATVDANGLVSAVNNGSATISVSNMGINGMVAVSVDVTPQAISIAPATSTIDTVGGTQALTVMGDFGADGMRDLTLMSRGTMYQASSSAVTVSVDGVVTAASPDTVTITATNRGQMATATVESLPNTTAMVAITIDKMTVATNGTDTATITATLTPVSAAGMIPDGTTVNFSATNGMLSASSATTTNGVATVTIASGAAVDGDMADITASSDGFMGVAVVSNTVTVTFRDRFLNVAPAMTTLSAFSGANGSQQLTVTDGLTAADLTNDANTTYMSSDTDVVTVNATGLVTAVNNGIATVTASNTGANGTASFTVDVTPQAITIAPANSAIAMVGGTQALMVTGDFGADGMRDQTLMARGTMYQSSDDTVATVSVDGVVTAVRPGTVTITATNRGQMATATVESLPNTTAMVAITIDKMTVATNGTDVATITATLTPTGASGMIPDGTAVNFSATNGMLSASSATTTNGVATVTIASGAAVDGDMANITATTGGFQGAVLTSNTLTVTFRDRFLQVTPAMATLTALSGANSTQQLAVVDSVSSNDVTTDANTTYMSADTTVATVNATGLVTAFNNGVTMITVSNTGATGTFMVTVNADPANGITAAPTTVTFTAATDTQQLAVTGDFGGGITRDITGMSRGTSYTSNNAGVAAVSVDGLISATGPGMTTITVTNGTQTTTVNVTSDFPTDFMVTANNTTINNGDMEQLMVTGNNPSATDLSGQASYQSSNTDIIRVSPSGVVTGVRAGMAMVTVSVTGFTDKMITFTVNDTVNALVAPIVTVTQGQQGAMMIIDFTSVTTAMGDPAAFNLDITLPTGVTIPNNANNPPSPDIQAGPVLTAAAKSVSSNDLGGGTYRALTFGLNQNVIASGNALIIPLNVAAGAPTGTFPITITNVTVSSGGGQTLPSVGISGQITIN